ncbi:hypothetical protein [Streptomyces microflavus]|uniref:hypothetical protein n=1 Tax=Streptomyces microflavus TaxID=1919 RepID=UPI0036A557C3
MRLFSTGAVLVDKAEDGREPPREEEAPELTAPSPEERPRPWLFRLPRPLPDPSPVPLPRPPDRPRPDMVLGVVRGPEERRTRPLGPFGLGVRER